MKIVYIIEFDYKNHSYVHKSYNEKYKYNLPRLTALESLIKSLKSVRQYYENEILLISDYVPKELKEFDLKHSKLEKDPYTERIDMLLELHSDFLFVEHDVFFTKNPFHLFTKSWVNMGTTKDPDDFHGDLFFLNHADFNEFEKEYRRVYKISFRTNEKCVFATNMAFRKIGATRVYDFLLYPQWNTSIYDAYGFHSHYDFSDSTQINNNNLLLRNP